eukprot:12341520-Karenia_brevis.AAC.1
MTRLVLWIERWAVDLCSGSWVLNFGSGDRLLNFAPSCTSSAPRPARRPAAVPAIALTVRPPLK